MPLSNTPNTPEQQESWSPTDKMYHEILQSQEEQKKHMMDALKTFDAKKPHKYTPSDRKEIETLFKKQPFSLRKINEFTTSRPSYGYIIYDAGNEQREAVDRSRDRIATEVVYKDRLSIFPDIKQDDMPHRLKIASNTSTKRRKAEHMSAEIDENSLILDTNAFYYTRWDTAGSRRTKYGLHRHLSESYDPSKPVDKQYHDRLNITNSKQTYDSYLYIARNKGRPIDRQIKDIRHLQDTFVPSKALQTNRSEKKLFPLSPSYLIEFAEHINLAIPQSEQRQWWKYAITNPLSKGYAPEITTKSITIEQILKHLRPHGWSMSRSYVDIMKHLFDQMQQEKKFPIINKKIQSIKNPEKITELIINELYNHIQTCY